MKRLRHLGNGYFAFGALLLVITVALAASADRIIGKEEAPEYVRTTLLWVSYLQMAGGALLSILLILVGASIRACKHYNFCRSVAVLICVCFPFGTALGIYSWMVLADQEIRSLFASVSRSDSRFC